MALTQDRETRQREGLVLSLPLAAAARVYGGGLVAVNAAGEALPAADAAGLKVAGVAENGADNAAGAAGDKVVAVRRGRAFKFRNSDTSPVGAAQLLTDVYVEDDETVAASGGTNSIVAGTCLEVEADGVWVEIR